MLNDINKYKHEHTMKSYHCVTFSTVTYGFGGLGVTCSKAPPEELYQEF